MQWAQSRTGGSDVVIVVAWVLSGFITNPGQNTNIGKVRVKLRVVIFPTFARFVLWLAFFSQWIDGRNVVLQSIQAVVATHLSLKIDLSAVSTYIRFYSTGMQIICSQGHSSAVVTCRNRKVTSCLGDQDDSFKNIEEQVCYLISHPNEYNNKDFCSSSLIFKF